MIQYYTFDEMARRLTEFLAKDDLRIGLRTEENILVDKGVLVLRSATFFMLRVGVTNNGLDLVAVDETGDTRV